MLAFRSLDPCRALREPDRRRRDEERLSRSEQRTLSKTQNNHLTGKAPYKFDLVPSLGCELAHLEGHIASVLFTILPEQRGGSFDDLPSLRNRANPPVVVLAQSSA